MCQSKTIAEQMAEKINAKLGYRPVQPVEEEKEPEAPPAETFKRYEEELEINDFPQTARWKVTSKASALDNRAAPKLTINLPINRYKFLTINFIFDN